MDFARVILSAANHDQETPMSGESPMIRPGRLAAAWLVCTACGCIGAAAWMPFYGWIGKALSALPPLAHWQQVVLGQVAMYGSLFAFIGVGIYCGLRLSRKFLSAVELEVLFRLSRDEEL